VNIVDLGSYRKVYAAGNPFRNALWYFVNMTVFQTAFPFPVFLQVLLLRLFGASVGNGVNIKPRVSIKYPWLLAIGRNVWLGEGIWIDNLSPVTVGNNVCISQGARLLTGNHDYKKNSFDLIIAPITVEDGVWVGAHAVVCPGVTLASHSVVTAGSVVTKNTEAFTIYQGNPARPVRLRVIDRSQ
jgi:putative colanic acid biosynthesis acetyltransferase WcaF